MSAEDVSASEPALPRGLVILLGLASAVVVAAGLRYASGLVAPVFLALMLTVAVAPLPQWARRHGTPSWAATILALLAVYAVVLAIAFGLAISAVKLAATLPQYADRATQIVSEIGDRLHQAGFNKAPTDDALKQVDLGRLAGAVESLLAGVLGLLGNFFFLVTLLFFLAAEATGMGGRAAELARTRPRLTAALGGFVKGTQRYLVVTTVFGGIVAVLDGVALWLLGVPLPWVWALLAFLTNYIPNVGFILGIVPPALLALLDDGVGHMLVVIAVYCAINVVLQTFIQPRFVGDAVGLSTTMTFLSLALWSFLLGPLGALLAVPMTLLVRAVLIDADPRSTWAGALLGPVPKEPRPARHPDGSRGTGEPSGAAPPHH
jgi:predicted PurR-regulated permease PerM